MNELVYPRERTLGTITLVVGLLIWLGLIIGTFGAALIVLAVGFVLYLFAQSALIAHIKGNGVELSETQFPDLYTQFTACCDRLQMQNRPQVYILNGNGGLNAFATKFLGAQFVVLMSDVVDAMDKHSDGVRFYIGHELGHLRMKHLSGHFLRWPALWLPLIGQPIPALARAPVIVTGWPVAVHLKVPRERWLHCRLVQSAGKTLMSRHISSRRSIHPASGCHSMN